jgi:hypothetical protein
LKKIISLFMRHYEGTRLVFDQIVPGAEWVALGEGIATEKYDGTCCMVRSGQLFKRYDRKLSKSARKRLKREKLFIPDVEHFKPVPEGWEAAETEPNRHTGHWPGWVPVNDKPEDQWHREAYDIEIWAFGNLPDATYELVGPKVQGNPYGTETHRLLPHGQRVFSQPPPRDFEGLRRWFKKWTIEGIVWHHLDGRMVKIKRKDFGYDWPTKN